MTDRHLIAWCTSCHQLAPVDADGICGDCEKDAREVLKRLAEGPKVVREKKAKAVAAYLDGIHVRDVP